MSKTLEARADTAPAPDYRFKLIKRAAIASIFGVGAAIVAPFFLDVYSTNILVRSMIYASIALSVDMLWGYLGILTFGQSAFFALGAYATAMIYLYSGFSIWHSLLAIGSGVGLSLVVAYALAKLAFWRGASDLYASVITLVLPVVLTQLIFYGGSFTGSSSGLTGFNAISLSLHAWFAVVGIFLVISTAIMWIYTRSDAGSLLTAVRENEQRCTYVGLNTNRVKTVAFVVCGGIAAFAGWLYANYTMVVAPEISGFIFGTQLLVWVALGGRGTLFGPVLGTIFIDYASAQLQGDFPFIWQLAIGILFVVVIVVLPRGLLPLVAKGLGLVRNNSSQDKTKGPLVLEPIAQISKPDTINASDNVTALSVKSVKKSFGALQVLTDISFDANYGEIVSLIGPNGAGKTTLISCIADGSKRSAGDIVVAGSSIKKLPPEACVEMGIGRKFQMANIFDTLTVGECLKISRARLDGLSTWQRSNVCRLPSASMHIVEATGLKSVLNHPARDLSHGQKQALELAMVFALEPKVVLLDEPTAGLTKAERTTIGKALNQVVHSERLCILLVEHDLEFVRDISSRVVVLHQGAIVLNGSVEEVVNSELVKEVYAGASAH